MQGRTVTVDGPPQKGVCLVSLCPTASSEIVTIDPDILFVETYNNADPNAPPLSEILARNPLWGQLTAVRTGAMHEVDTGLGGTGRGTRSLGAVAEEALKLAGSQK